MECRILVLKREKELLCKVIVLVQGPIVNQADVKGYVCLGIIKRGNIFQYEMKKRTKKDYLKKLRTPVQSKSNGENIIKITNNWPAPTIRIEAGIINRAIKYLKPIDTKKAKLLNMDGGLHPSTYVDRRYISKDLVRRDLKFG